NVLYVPNIKKNLVSGFKLCKSGVKAVIESDKVILSKSNIFVGKAYACDGMFKLNINNITSSPVLPPPLPVRPPHLLPYGAGVD
nr:polyprotein, putative [Tanacetum cinerariifolium]